MATAIIGVGNIGRAVAKHLVGGGERVVLSARTQRDARAVAAELGSPASAATVEAAIAQADAVLSAVMFDAMKALVSESSCVRRRPPQPSSRGDTYEDHIRAHGRLLRPRHTSGTWNSAGMRAAWYEHRGSPRESLVVGEMPDPQPGEGEVRIALRVSGVNPGDVKKRSGWQGSPMPYPRVVPHSDGAGTIDVVGPGVGRDREGERVWCYGAQSYRPFGTAAEYVVVPDQLAVALPSTPAPDAATDLEEQASCLGIAGITGYRAVFADGGVSGLTVLVHGAAGGVGSIATQMARRDGATVIAVVMDELQRDRATRLGAHHAFLNGQPDLAERIRDVAPRGVHRIAEVDFASHIDLDSEVLAVGGVVCSYFSLSDRPAIPYWKLGFKDVALRLLGSDDFTPGVKADAARALTEALVDGSLRSHIAARFPLEDIVAAHESVENGAGGRVLLTI